MSTPQTTNGRGSDGAQGPPAGVAPPHSIEAEQSVLGAMLLSDRTHYAFVIEEGLKVEDFYRERHREVYESMLALFTAGESIDVLTVTEHLRSRGRLDAAGGQAEIDTLTAAVPAVGNLRQYAQIVRDRALLRRLLAASYEIQAHVHGHEAPPRELVEWAERAVLEVAHDDRQKDFRQVGEVLHAEVRKWQELSAEGRSLTGTPSGFADLDAITGGFQPGNLIIIAARPSMGKCVGASALVYDPMTGARRRMDEVVALIEGGEEVHVASVGPDLKLRATRATAAFRNGVRPLYRLTTRLGRRIEATANHPLLTIERLAPPGRAGARIAHCGAAAAAATGVRADDARPRDRHARRPHRRRQPDHGSPQFAFGTGSPIVDEVAEAAAAFGTRLSKTTPGNATISAGPGAKSNPVRELCDRHGLWGLRSAEKFVPEAIFGLDEGRLERFLAVLYACDGHAYASDRLHQIGYSTISERLACDVQHLLLRLGIVSRIRTLHRAVYDGTDKVAREVLITGQEGLATFCSRVRVCGKSAQLARVVAGLRRVGPGTNVDTVPPAVWSAVLEAKGARTWADVSVATDRPRNHNWHVGMRGLSRPLIGELAQATADEGLQALATSDLWWDEVASIEQIGEQETFDITVPGDHNFVADDVVVHNSALVTNMAENVALNKDNRRPVALFSLEMSEAELAQRFIASQASIKGDDLRKGRLRDEAKWKRVLRTAGEYDAAPLYVDDSSDIGIMDVRAKARRLHQQAQAEYGGLGLVIVDYLQLMRADSRIENRVQQVGEMSRGLKILARELSVPVIALSQLSRGVESRTDKRPMLSDLRESGQIEQDADLVMFIYRDEYYFPETTDKPGEAELIIAKHRNGGLGDVPLTFQNEYPRFLGLQRAA